MNVPAPAVALREEMHCMFTLPTHAPSMLMWRTCGSWTYFWALSLKGAPFSVARPLSTPLQAPVRQLALRDYPDLRLRQFLLRGLREGFWVGYIAAWGQLRPAKRNIPLAYEHPEVVDRYLVNECTPGRVLGPL